MVANMKQLLYLILVLPLLGMTPPNKEAKQREVVEEYVHTLLNTDDDAIRAISNNEDIVKLTSLLKLTRAYTKDEIDHAIDFLLYVKRTLQGHKYKILNFKEANKKLRGKVVL